jgi:hypothetical protein
MQQMPQPQAGSPAAKAGSSRITRRPRPDGAAGELTSRACASCDAVLHIELNFCTVTDLLCIRACWLVSSEQSA